MATNIFCISVVNIIAVLVVVVFVVIIAVWSRINYNSTVHEETNFFVLKLWNFFDVVVVVIVVGKNSVYNQIFVFKIVQFSICVIKIFNRDKVSEFFIHGFFFLQVKSGQIQSTTLINSSDSYPKFYTNISITLHTNTLTIHIFSRLSFCYF